MLAPSGSPKDSSVKAHPPVSSHHANTAAVPFARTSVNVSPQVLCSATSPTVTSGPQSGSHTPQLQLHTSPSSYSFASHSHSAGTYSSSASMPTRSLVSTVSMPSRRLDEKLSSTTALVKASRRFSSSWWACCTWAVSASCASESPRPEVASCSRASVSIVSFTTTSGVSSTTSTSSVNSSSSSSSTSSTVSSSVATVCSSSGDSSSTAMSMP